MTSVAVAVERASGRDFVRYGIGAVVFGALIGWALAGFTWRPRTILQGSLIGLTCFAMAFLAEARLHDWFEAKPGAWWRRVIVYFAASQVGWLLGLFLGTMVIWGQLPGKIRLTRVAWIVVIAMGAIGTFAGLAAIAFDGMKRRLSISIEQLKEAEFAEKELHLARELQARMLPQAEITGDGYRIASRNFAARYVAGDFYDVFQHSDGAIGIALADVAGKGLAASLIMASVKSVLALLASTRSVSDAMKALNEKLLSELSKREFVALALARYEPASGTVALSNAGVPDPYLIRRDGTVEAISVAGGRLPLGLRRDVHYDEINVHLEPGDGLLLFSDGLPEAPTTAGEPLGYDALIDIVRSVRGDLDRILERVQAATAEGRDDDQTMVLLQRVS